MGVWPRKSTDTTFPEGVTRAVIQAAPGTNTGGFHLDSGGRSGVEEGCCEMVTGQVLKAGWEVTNGKRGESWKDAKSGRSSMSKEGTAPSVEHIIAARPQQKRSPSRGWDPEVMGPSW